MAAPATTGQTATGNDNTSAVTNFNTGSIMVNAGEIILCVIGCDTTGRINAITFNGSSFTRIHQQDNSGVSVVGELWICASPTPGSAVVNVAKNGGASSNLVSAAVAVFSGARSGTPYAGVTATQGVNDDASLDVTTTVAESLVIDAMSLTAAGGAMTKGGSQTQIVQGTGNAYRVALSYQSAPTPTGYTMTWTWPTSTSFTQIGLFLQPPAVVVANTRRRSSSQARRRGR